MSDTVVPCNGCTLCCHNDLVRLLPGDDVASYHTEPHEIMPGERQLAHKPDGDCVYLTPVGCSIHHRRPRMCRTMDCRNIFRAVSEHTASRLGMHHVWRKGMDLTKAGSPRGVRPS